MPAECSPALNQQEEQALLRAKQRKPALKHGTGICIVEKVKCADMGAREGKRTRQT